MYHSNIVLSQRENMIPFFPNSLDMHQIINIIPNNANNTTVVTNEDDICKMQTQISYEDLLLKQCPRPPNVEYYQVPNHVYKIIEFGNKIVCLVNHEQSYWVVCYDHSFSNPIYLCGDVCTINIGDDNKLHCFPMNTRDTIKIFNENFEQETAIPCAIPLPHFRVKKNDTCFYYVYSASTQQIHVIDVFGRRTNIPPISHIYSADNSIEERLTNVKAFFNLDCGCIIMINNYNKLLIIDPNNFTIIHLFELKYNALSAQVVSDSSFDVYYNNNGLVERFELKDLPLMI